MPPAAVGAAFVWLGASTATATAAAAVTSAVYVGAVTGAVTAAVTHVVMGGDTSDILDSAVKGAVIGGVSGGVMKGVGIAANGLSAADKAKYGHLGVDAPKVGNAGLEATAGNPAASDVSGQKIAIPGQEGITRDGRGLVAAEGRPSASPNPGTPTPPQKPGILSRVGGWIEDNPTQAMLLGQTAGGVAQGVGRARAAEKEAEGRMDLAKLQIDSQKVGGLDQLDFRSPLPTIDGFTKRPKWRMPESGLLGMGSM